jgi:hypothetical protein
MCIAEAAGTMSGAAVAGGDVDTGDSARSLSFDREAWFRIPALGETTGVRDITFAILISGVRADGLMAPDAVFCGETMILTGGCRNSRALADSAAFVRASMADVGRILSNAAHSSRGRAPGVFSLCACVAARALVTASFPKKGAGNFQDSVFIGAAPAPARLFSRPARMDEASSRRGLLAGLSLPCSRARKKPTQAR